MLRIQVIRILSTETLNTHVLPHDPVVFVQQPGRWS